MDDEIRVPTGCASWIRRSSKPHHHHHVLLLFGRCSTPSSPPLLRVFAFHPLTSSLSPSPLVECEVDGEPLRFAVHPSGDEFVCATTNGCRLYELNGQDSNMEIVVKEFGDLQNVGPQKCLAFSTDGSRFASGGEDGHLRIFEWSTHNLLLDEPKAHSSFRDIDISLDSAFLATTSFDGSARIWKINDGVPLTSLTRDGDEKIGCCRFSRDGTKPFLFSTVQRGNKWVTAVWDISTWDRIGHKRLLRKPTSALSTSQDGKYLALGSNDGDICVVEVKKMEICHWSKKLHPGTSVSSIEFCPTDRIVLSTSSQQGAIITRLNVAEDWKVWQIYLLLLGLFLVSLAVFYVLYENSDSFWNFPKSGKPSSSIAFVTEPEIPDDQSVW